MNRSLMLLCIVILLAGCIVIEEDEEKGNRSGRKLNVSFDLEKKTEEPERKEESSTKPDLEVTNIYWSTLFPDAGEEAELNIRIINNGNASVDGFSYKITLFKSYDLFSEDIFEYEETLPPGNKTKLEQSFSFNITGQFKAEAYLDWDNSIKEYDELNNYKQTPLITVSEAEPDSEEDTEEDESTDQTNVTLGSNKCVDTDTGINYYEKGRCTDDGPFILGMSDYCQDNRQIIELYCTNRTQRCKFAEPYKCAGLCREGACV